MIRSRRVVLLSVAIAVLAVGGLGLWRWPHAVSKALFGPPPGPGTIVVSGNIEAHESVLSFTQVQASIIELPFDEAATVAKDTVLARLDDSLYRRQIEIDRANLGVASAQVAAYDSTLAAVQSNVSSAGFDLVEKQRDFGRGRSWSKPTRSRSRAAIWRSPRRGNRRQSWRTTRPRSRSQPPMWRLAKPVRPRWRQSSRYAANFSVDHVATVVLDVDRGQYPQSLKPESRTSPPSSPRSSRGPGPASCRQRSR